ncbi:serine/threonine-protein kinase [Mycobacterium sp. E740]|uniref:serine/threonine-protein kinase n=1 Tax=Mycobacterium sp. E740 TaxID=1834149 RepID=UPI0008003F75|nr:serine/threonine-protein kinase [Mycobacterium sp. E740]OBI76232.1 protein kinase [Mycobacterium sp. E740]
MTDPEREGSRVGSQIGPYRLRRLLGKGGMGEVYEAEDTVKDRIVALKLLPESASSDPVFRKRLQREAHSAGRLQEPHVVPIHDYGEVDGLLYVDMRMIDGTDLRKALKDYGPMAPARAVAIVKQIAAALDAAHESGIMHRDVKPENIILTRDDFAYLVDFGIANAATDEKLTELGTAVGTYAYMAPERFTGDEVTSRADVYALSCVLHECLTGSQPFPGDSVSVVITAHLMQPVPKPSQQRPGVPAALDAVIARGMAKNPQDRYATAGDLAAAANDALTQRDQDQTATILQRSQPAPSAPPPAGWHHTPPPMPRPPGLAGHPGPPGPPRPPRKNTTWIPIAVAAAVFALVLGAVGIWFLVKPDDESSASATSDTERTTSNERTTRRSAPNPDSFDAKLLELLPSGYDDTVCEAVHPPATGALATVDCRPPAADGSPPDGRYSLFADQQTLDKAFDDSVAANSELLTCPNSDVGSPTTWHYDATPDQVAGRIACGVFDGNQDVAWTKNVDLLLGDAQSDNLDELHKWWLKYG